MPRIQGIHTPSSAKNLAINGALDFWQEKLNTTTTINTATPGTVWIADMVRASHAGSSTKNFSVVRSTDVPTPAESGFDSVFSSLWTQLTGLASPSTTDILNPFLYSMEGYDYAQIHGKKATFGFWIKGSVAGTYGFSLRNENSDRTYRTTFAINQPNTWEFKSITVQMDTQGTWNLTNGRGVLVAIGSTGGTSVSAAPSTSWNADGLNVVSGVTNWTGTTNATLRIAMFSIVEGSLGFGAKGFQRANGVIEQEFIACQRYYRTNYDGVLPGAVGAGGRVSVSSTDTGNSLPGVLFGTPMRAAPTVTLYSNGTGATPRVRRYNGATDVVVSGVSVTSLAFHDIAATLAANAQYDYMFVADARL